MSKPVISVEHLTKKYELGVIGTGTLTRDLERWWARLRGQPDPYTRIGQKDAFARIGESILALDDVSFTVEQGEALGIIGKNGAGKSTLLKILSRVTAPTSGVVKVKGRIGSLLEVGTGFHPELTGRENIYLNGAILGMKKAEVARKFDEIVDFSGVEKFIDTPVKRYSSGMYVRLAFAVAAHLDPEILVVDEVLAVGDAEFQKKCMGKMGDVTGEGRTVLFVSHNMRSIIDLCKKCVLLNNGMVEKEGPTKELVDYYIDGKSISKAEKAIVANAKNRRYKGPSELISVWLEDEKGEEKYLFKTNEKIIFCVETRNLENNSVIGINVRTINEVTMFHITNIDDKFEIKTDQKHDVVKASVTNNPLRNGDYFVSIWLGDRMGKHSDSVLDVLSFHVDDTHLGNLLSSSPILIKGEWKMDTYN